MLLELDLPVDLMKVIHISSLKAVDMKAFIIPILLTCFMLLASPDVSLSQPLKNTVEEIGIECVKLVRVAVLNFMLIYGLYLGISLAFGQTQATDLTTFLLGAIIAVSAGFIAALFGVTLFRNPSAGS
jgi:phosphoglycerol transferase MdoB-like AlkP superfamily enzyme